MATHPELVPSPCRCCGKPADSKEHVFTDAIGGRLEFPGILCRRCNSTFGTTIDASLNKTFWGVRLMLAIYGKSGPPPNMLVEDETGRKVLVGPGFLPSTGGAPEVKTEANADGSTKVHIRGTEKQLRQVLDHYKEKHGEKAKIQVDDATHHYDFPGRVEIPFDVDSMPFRRSATKTALVFAEACCPSLSPALAKAWTFVRGTSEDSIDGFEVGFTAAPSPWAPALGDVAHTLLLDADPAGNRVLFDVRFFGGFAVRGSIRADVPITARLGHGIDPTTGRQADGAGWTGRIDLDDLTPDALSRMAQASMTTVLSHWRLIESELLAKKVVRDAVREVGHDPREVMRVANEKVAILKAREKATRVDAKLVERLAEKFATKNAVPATPAVDPDKPADE